MDIKAAKKYIAVIERALGLLKQSLEVDELIEIEEIPVESEAEKHKKARAKHVQDLLAIDSWPTAVQPHLVANDTSDEDQINRAAAVLDMLLTKSLENKHFLDFGCGDGWIAREAMKRGAATSTGYDVQTSKTWEKIKNVNFTSNFKDLKKEHYEVIFIYDVLDHCFDPSLFMEQVKSIAKKGALIYVRCHPWCSKHGSHLYKKGLNKAYIHLFLTWDELTSLDYGPLFTRPEKNPLEAYRWWLHEFKMEKERIIREPVSEFFHVPSFKELLINEQQLEADRKEGFFKDMEIQFVDFLVSKP